MLKRGWAKGILFRLYRYLKGKLLPREIPDSNVGDKLKYSKAEEFQIPNKNRLRIFFHIGPHKTGTTSIQAYLLRRFGDKKPSGSVWYPVPEKMGPGHAHLASLMNDKNFDPDLNSLRFIIKEAQSYYVEQLMLSSEDFVGAYPDKFKRYADALEGHDIVIISTQNSLINRAASLWQEMVKHGYTCPITDSSDRILSHPGYQPDFLKTFAQALKPQSIVIVYSSLKDPPKTLVHRMLMAMGLSYEEKYDPDASVRRNVRLGYIEVEILRHFNQLLQTHAPEVQGQYYTALRKVFMNSLHSKTWREICPQIPIDTPEYIKKAVSQRALQITKELESLSGEWNVQIFGSPKALQEDTD